MIGKITASREWILMAAAFLWLYLSSTCGQQYVERYVYSERSCEDLIPRHSSLFTTTSTSTTTQASNDPDKTTVRPTTRRTTRRVPSRPAIESLKTSVEVTMLNGYSYAPGRMHNVMIKSVIPFEGLMVQIRKNATTIVGSFVEVPPMMTTIKCPYGQEDDNTAIDNDAPVMLSNINLVWMAPKTNLGILNLRLSLVIGNEYQTVERSLMPSTLPPLDDSTCGLKQSCFRACPESMEFCTFPQTLFSAVIRNTTNNQSAVITIGARIGLLRNYGAIGFTEDNENLSQMDLNVCYSPDMNRSSIEFTHLYLQNKDIPPLPHQGVVFIDTSYMDGNVLWCQFTRRLTGNNPSKLNLEDPMYIFFFRGHQHEGDFRIPEMRHMMRIHSKVSHKKGLPFNTYVYLRGNDANVLHGCFTLVTLLNVFFLSHFLNLI